MYGTNAADRSKELDILAQCVACTMKVNRREKDIILLGDFNNPPSHEVNMTRHLSMEN